MGFKEIFHVNADSCRPVRNGCFVLHQRARENGQSVGAEASFIIAAARHEHSVPETGNTWTRQLIDLGQSIGGTDLDIIPREGNITPYAKVSGFKV